MAPFCPKCFQYAVIETNKPQIYAWLIHLQCSICLHSWLVCRDCPSDTRKHALDDNSAINRHKYNYHRDDPSGVQDETASGMVSGGICTTCLQVGKPVERQQEHNWMIQFTCPKCPSGDWFVCKDCASARVKQLVDQKAVTRHHRTYHMLGQQRAKHLKISAQDDTDNMFLENDNEEDETPTDKFLHFGRVESRCYFEHASNNMGLQYLVSRSYHDTKFVMPGITTDDVELHLSLAALCMDISRTQRYMLQKVLQTVVRATTQSSALQLTESPLHSVPQTDAQLRSLYLEGRSSIKHNLPHPRVDSVHGHAFVSLKEVIRDMLGRGTAVECGNDEEQDANAPVRRVVDSKRYKEILKRARECHPDQPDVLVLWMNEWSDDFEPNNTKGNRGSVWLKTVTICSCHDNKHCTDNTYPIALGPKGSNHDPIEDKFASELISLSDPEQRADNWFYEARTGTMVLVYAEMFVVLQDQPERRGANHLLAGNSNVHKLFGSSADLKSIKDVMPACPTCLAMMLQPVPRGSTSTRSCTVCVNWSLHTQSELLNFQPPPHYPESEVPESGFLRPFRLDYQALHRAVTKARINLANEAWSELNGLAYLGTYCLTDSIVHDLLEPAQLRARLNAAKATLPSDDDVRLLLEEVESNQPTWLVDIPLPPLWRRCVDIRQHIDVIMHLLFLGIVKTITKVTREWTKLKGKHSAFLIYARNVLESIPTVPWLAVAPYTGDKLGGWVSENYLALARLSKWFYGGLDQIAVEVPYVAPSVHHSQWLKVMNVKWLQHHGISFASVIKDAIGGKDLQRACQGYVTANKKAVSSASAAVAKQMVAAYHATPNKIPVSARNKVCSVESLQMMLQSLHTMIALIMGTSVDKVCVDEIDRHIKIFLTIFASVDESMKADGSREPQWVTSYNFLSLLNIPGMVAEFGPLRNLWEGGIAGEGFIRKAKPKINTGLRKNWAENTMALLLQQQALQYLLASTSPASKDTVRNRSKNYHRYINLDTVVGAHAKREPLSAVVLDDGCFVVVIQGDKRNANGTDRYVPLVREPNGKEVNGCHYHEWHVDLPSINSLPDLPLKAAGSSDDWQSVMLLPMLGKNGLPERDDDPLYTVIDSDWNEINAEGILCTPTLHFQTFIG